MTTKTAAQAVAEMFGEDGRCFRILRGNEEVTLGDACLDAGAKLVRVQPGRDERGHELTETAYVYAFADGSAIVNLGGAWDLRPEGCEGHCWAGVGCQCEDEDAASVWTIKSVKGTETVSGTLDEAIAAAKAHDERLQPAYGVDLYRGESVSILTVDDGVVTENVDLNELRISLGEHEA